MTELKALAANALTGCGFALILFGMLELLFKDSIRKQSQGSDDLIERLRKRASIRRQISTRKSVQNNEPDRLADLLDEAAFAIEKNKRN